ncbi:hypothetical protein BsWGS_24223 [Bradybaena similaris]
MAENLAQCYDLLTKTGRTFELTINYFDKELRDAFCLFYLVLRAVDTVEDDVKLPDDVKITMMNSFDKYLQDPVWKFTESNIEDGIVLEKFPCITQALREIPSKYTDIIVAEGVASGREMIHFIGKELMTLEDMNEYCRKVSYTFAIGFANLFVASGLEAEVRDTSLVMSFAYFLQKVNRLRDYKKDQMCGKNYFSKDVWGKYVNNLEDFLKPEYFSKGVECVKELALDALQHLITYLELIKGMRSSSAIKFFGIHLVIGIATLDRCYNNPKVFVESVKIGRDETLHIVETTESFADVLDKVQYYTERLMENAGQATGTDHSVMDICRQILSHIEQSKSN